MRLALTTNPAFRPRASAGLDSAERRARDAADASVDALQRAQQGDLDAFGEFVTLLERRVRGVLGRLLDDDRDVEEAAQDTFVQAWRNLDRLRGDSAPFTWLYRIAVNEALQRLRRKQLPTRSLDEVPGIDRGVDLAALGATPDVEAENRELLAFLADRVRDLPPDFRAALVLRDVVGLPNAEVAEILGVSVAAAKSRIHRARMTIRAELQAWEGEAQPREGVSEDDAGRRSRAR